MEEEGCNQVERLARKECLGQRVESLMSVKSVMSASTPPLSSALQDPPEGTTVDSAPPLLDRASGSPGF